jgi:hypothetical protein
MRFFHKCYIFTFFLKNIFSHEFFFEIWDFRISGREKIKISNSCKKIFFYPHALHIHEHTQITIINETWLEYLIYMNLPPL